MDSKNWGVKRLLSNRKKLLGLTFILIVSLIWVLASYIVKGIEASGAHPAVLTLVANSLFAIYLPIYWLNIRLKQKLGGGVAHQQELRNLMPPTMLQSDQTITRLEDVAPAAATEMSHRELFKAAIVVRSFLENEVI